MHNTTTINRFTHRQGRTQPAPCNMQQDERRTEAKRTFKRPLSSVLAAPGGKVGTPAAAWWSSTEKKMAFLLGRDWGWHRLRLHEDDSVHGSAKLSPVQQSQAIVTATIFLAEAAEPGEGRPLMVKSAAMVVSRKKVCFFCFWASASCIKCINTTNKLGRRTNQNARSRKT